MTSRISAGWHLARRSASVLRRHPSLIAFPGLAALAAIVAAALLAAPGVALAAATDAWWPLVPFAALAAYAATFTSIYFNVALAVAVAASLEGNVPRVRDGLAGARRRRGTIARWALVQATVGALLSGIHAIGANSPAGRVAVQLVSWLAGASWAAATFFVIPVLAFEGLGPRDAVKRSTQLVSERWGEGATGTGTIGLAVLIAGVIPATLLVALAAAIGGTAVPAALIALALLIAIAAAVAGPALTAIFRVALYRFDEHAI